MPTPIMIKFGQHLPDLPSLNNPGALTAQNVIPKEDSYGPLSALVDYSNALASACIGAAAYKSSDGALTVFAGTATKLYTLGSSTTSWTDATRASGTNYAADEHWSFNQFGDVVTAWNGVDTPQAYTMGTSTQFAALTTSPPVARYATNALEQVMVGNIAGSPNRVQWCGIDDLNTWGTNASAQSDFQDLLGYGNVMALAGTRRVDIWCERGIYRADYVAPPAVWSFQPIEKERGTIFPKSVIGYGDVSFGLSQDGFFVFDGVKATPIGQGKFSKTVLDEFNQTFVTRICSGIDPANQLIAWAYPSSNSVDGTPDRLLLYHWPTGRSSLCAVDCEFLCNTAAFDITLDDLDAISSSLDALAYSLDSRAWQASGNLLFAAFTSSHKLATFTGSALAAVIDTGEAQLFPGRKALVLRAWPKVEGTDVTMTVTPITRARQQDAVTVGSASTVNATGFAPLRSNARFHRGRLNIAAGGTWTHAIGLEFEPIQTGWR
jgi:hypothetical protein